MPTSNTKTEKQIISEWREEMRKHIDLYGEQGNGQWLNGMLCALDIMETLSEEEKNYDLPKTYNL